MKEYEQRSPEEDGLRGECGRAAFLTWLERQGACSGAPWLHQGVHSCARRLAVCNSMKRIEAKGKSKVIDAFVHKAIPVGAHRAFDPLHDPFHGPFHAMRAMGVKDTFKVWCPHMASDVLTPMSLPLPGTYKAGVDSLRYRLYAKGLVNVRSIVLAPVLNVALADLLVRADVWGRLEGRSRTPEERADMLLQTHAWNAAAAGVLAVATFVGPSAPAVTVAYATTAAWSALTAGGYYAVAHRDEIEAGLRAASARARAAAQRAIGTGRKLVERPLLTGAAAPALSAAAAGLAPARPVPPRVGAVRLGLAAAMLTVALACGRP